MEEEVSSGRRTILRTWRFCPDSRDYSGTYAIDLINKGTITLNPQMSDYSNVTYKLVKLTSKEMEWQREGTTYSVGTWGLITGTS